MKRMQPWSSLNSFAIRIIVRALVKIIPSIGMHSMAGVSSRWIRCSDEWRQHDVTPASRAYRKLSRSHSVSCTSVLWSMSVGTQQEGASHWVMIDIDRALSTSTVGWPQRKYSSQRRCRVFWAPHFFCDKPVTFQFSPDIFRGNPICLSISKCSICIPDLVACILEICIPGLSFVGCENYPSTPCVAPTGSIWLPTSLTLI